MIAEPRRESSSMYSPSDDMRFTPRSDPSISFFSVSLCTPSANIIADIGLLDVINSLLGLSVLVLLFLVFLRIIAEVSLHVRRKRAAPGNLAELLNKLGITMHDGGEKIENNHNNSDE